MPSICEEKKRKKDLNNSSNVKWLKFDLLYWHFKEKNFFIPKKIVFALLHKWINLFEAFVWGCNSQKEKIILSCMSAI